LKAVHTVIDYSKNYAVFWN